MIAPDAALAQLHQLRLTALIIAYALHEQRMVHMLGPILAAGRGQILILPGPDTN